MMTPMMDLRHWLMLALAAVLGAVATWLLCHWWYGRRIASLTARLGKSDKARLFSAQQTLQARKQIEALQKDLAAQQEAMAQAQIARTRNRHLEEVLKAASTAEDENVSRRPANGFADTQPMA
jgi:hypothetical protein